MLCYISSPVWVKKCLKMLNKQRNTIHRDFKQQFTNIKQLFHNFTYQHNTQRNYVHTSVICIPNSCLSIPRRYLSPKIYASLSPEKNRGPCQSGVGGPFLTLGTRHHCRAGRITHVCGLCGHGLTCPGFIIVVNYNSVHLSRN